MSLKSIGQGIDESLFGKDCRLCERFGVTCHDIGVFDKAPGYTGETVIYINGDAKLRVRENIAGCSAVLGKTAHKEVANKIKENAERQERKIYLSSIRIGNN